VHTQPASRSGAHPLSRRPRFGGHRRTSAAVALVVLVSLAGVTQIVGGPLFRPTGPSAPVRQTTADQPLAFEANVGQSDASVRFLGRQPGVDVFLTDSAATLGLRPGIDATTGAAVRLQPLGADPSAVAVGLDPLASRVNYLVGQDPDRWHTGVPTFARVVQQGVYPGIDFVYYGNGGELEYDAVVAPGADASAIRLGIEGGTGLRVANNGDLVVDTAAGPLTQRRPVAYQDIDGHRLSVAADYLVRGPAEVGLRLGAYDPGHALVIDPTLVYSTYLGGGGFDSAQHVAVDDDGAAYVAGLTLTNASVFPTTPGAFDTTTGSNRDAFVTKFDAAGVLQWSTFLGGTGTGTESGFAIAVGASGEAYVTGNTTSADFPVTAGAYDESYNSATNLTTDVYVTKLAADGASLLWSTFLGGNQGEQANTPGIALDSTGAVIVVGETQSANFPTSAGVVQPTMLSAQEAFVSKFSSTGTFEWSTFLGGVTGNQSESAFGVDADATGVYVSGATRSADFPTTAGAFDTTFGGLAGSDGFLTKLNPTGTAFLYSTFLGGADALSDSAQDVVVDASGNAFVGGFTSSPLFPTTPGAFDTTHAGQADGFVLELDPTGASLVYSTFLGGAGTESLTGIAVDTAGTAFVTGSAAAGYPTTTDALQPTLGGTGDAVVTQVSAGGTSLIYSSYFGGTTGTETGRGPALDGLGGVWIVGQTGSTDLPTTVGAFDTTSNGGGDGFVTKFAFPAPPPLFPLSLPGVVTLSTSWGLRDELTDGGPTTTFTLGTRPLVPIMGDWDGNGSKTPGTFEAGTFKLSNSIVGPTPPVDDTFVFGNSRGFPVVGDWNGDGTDDVAVVRAGGWQTRLSIFLTTDSFTFGPAVSWPSVVPVAGDWNADGTDGIGTYNRSSSAGPVGQWNLRSTASTGGTADAGTFTYNPGTSPYPVVGDWNADGTDTVGVMAAAIPASWMLNNANDGSPADITFAFGATNDFPVVWSEG